MLMGLKDFAVNISTYYLCIMEALQQHTCYMWFIQTYPEQRGLLYMNYNNPPNGRKGAQLIGMGLVAGVADLTYLAPNGQTAFIELKTEFGKVSKVQADWAKKIATLGHPYHVCNSLEDFQAVVGLYNYLF
jgi:hypothetical protein